MLSKLLHKLGIQNGEVEPPASPFERQACDLIAAYKGKALVNGNYRHDYHLKEIPSGRAILDAAPELQSQLAVSACVQLMSAAAQLRGNSSYYNETFLLKGMVSELLRRKLPLSEAQICYFLRLASMHKSSDWLPVATCVTAAERFVADHGMTDQVGFHLDALIKRHTSRFNNVQEQKFVQRLTKLRRKAEPLVVVELTGSEHWSAAVLAFLDGLEPERCRTWSQLLAHAASGTTSKPSQKWLKSAQAIVEGIGTSEFRKQLLEWFSLAEQGGRHVRPQGVTGETGAEEHLMMDPVNAQTLKGLVWCATVLGEDAEVAQSIGRLAVACYRKIPWVGARSTAVGNACVWALGAIPGKEAVGQLAFVRMKSKYRAAQHGIQKSLSAAAEREGVAAEDLEELATPTCGLSEVGRRIETLGDFIAELVVKDTHTIELKWSTSSGKAQKSVPASVKRDFGAKLKELKAAQKNLQKLVPAQRSRIESFYQSGKRWNYGAWRERYLDHLLVGTIARRLIWRFVATDGALSTGVWHEGSLVDAHGRSIDGLSPETMVELWHPVGAMVEEVVAWRESLERLQITQPFKQAHREVYLLTDAERQTETYSNRFAAHILKQHQFAALCHERGWRYTLQGAFDSSNTPTIDLPQLDLRVEYWVEPVDSDERTEMYIYLYVSTDQVRFYRLHDNGPMRLEEVPPLLFSELMRDVDLFVGVSSVGNDPHWIDGGQDARHYAYWHSYSFGDLTESAATRRDVLARLVPRLKIADRCRLDDKFLIVRGDIRSYKIHLGSGNILMTPNDSYLCIVPGQGVGAKDAGRVYLPFEGDRVLSIILSKAIMLANDTKIADRSIVSQLRGR